MAHFSLDSAKKEIHWKCYFNTSSFREGFPGGPVVKNPSCNAGDDSSISGLRRSPGEENATHSSILALEIQGTEKSDRLQSMGSQRMRHNLAAKPPLSPLLVYFIYLSIYVSMYVCIYLSISISIRWVCIYLFSVSAKLNFYSALFLAPGILVPL